jgi:hypothetical protein
LIIYIKAMFCVLLLLLKYFLTAFQMFFKVNRSRVKLMRENTNSMTDYINASFVDVSPTSLRWSPSLLTVPGLSRLRSIKSQSLFHCAELTARSLDECCSLT